MDYQRLRPLIAAEIRQGHRVDLPFLRSVLRSRRPLREARQARKLLNSARQFDLSWCRDAVAMAAETDLAMKSAGRDPEELLVELVLKLAASRQGVRGC